MTNYYRLQWKKNCRKPTLLFYHSEPSYQFAGKDDNAPTEISREEMQGISGGSLEIRGDGILTVGYPAEFLRGSMFLDPRQTGMIQNGGGDAYTIDVSDVIFIDIIT